MCELNISVLQQRNYLRSAAPVKRTHRRRAIPQKQHLQGGNARVAVCGPMAHAAQLQRLQIVHSDCRVRARRLRDGRCDACCAAGNNNAARGGQQMQRGCDVFHAPNDGKAA